VTRSKILTRVAGVTLLSASLTLVPALTAHAAAQSTGSLSASTVDAGGTVDLTITPADTGGVSDWCGIIGGDPTPTSSPGFSAAVVLYTFPTMTRVWQSPGGGPDGPLDGPGLGSFTPDTVSSPFTITITIPSDIPAGDYLLGSGCLGPTNVSRDDNTGGIGGFITINAAPEPSPSPEPTPGNSLPDTGLSLAEIVPATLVGAASVICGTLLLYRRRFAKR
jgi:hypothetical protein